MLKVGQVFKTNFWGDVEVVEYINTRNVTVKFANTGNEKVVQMDALRKGLVADTKEKADRSKERFKQERLKAESYKQYIAECISKKEERRAASKAAREEKVKSSKLGAESKRRAFWLGKYTDKFGWELEVVDERPGWVDIVYTSSGNKYSIRKVHFKNRGAVVPNDKLHPDYEWESFLRREEKSIDGLSESQRQAAASWQKANSHKYKVSLKRQQEKLKSAVGSHSEEELTALLELQGNKCACCGDSLDGTRNKHKDHKTPVSKGGTDFIDNIQYLCSVCNKVKGTKSFDLWEKYKGTEVFKRKWEKLKGRKWGS